MKKYLFDVDGTLTPSRKRIDAGFKYWFTTFVKDMDVYIVTGSDREKTIEQLTPDIYNHCKRVYQCSGNDVWERDKHIRSNQWDMPDNVRADLQIILKESKFYHKTGKHFDERPGLVNFSIVGRGCNLEQRAMYKQWDEHKNERVNIANKMSKKYPNIKFEIAGETGIDITPPGGDKSQILEDFNISNDEIYFFGDNCEPGGNDYSLYNKLDGYGASVYHVKDWKETWDILKGR
jgi:phosphomannomutase